MGNPITGLLLLALIYGGLISPVVVIIWAVFHRGVPLRVKVVALFISVLVSAVMLFALEGKPFP